jgi:hypothetical protein
MLYKSASPLFSPLEHAGKRGILADRHAEVKVHHRTGAAQLEGGEVVAGAEAAIEYKVTDGAWEVRCDGS